ncbi:MAG: efflux RND transporter periplasmic adaptor subunit, partial [Deltaproteobacteria bacterium]|nr:efflux RND transporter periplasmic adaptor subunit [Deltaproteobacteria bacterium]
IFSNGKNKVTVEKVMIDETASKLSIPATIEPSQKAAFQFPIELKVVKLHAQAGDSVAVGNPLFDLDEIDLALRVSKLKAELAKEEAKLEKNRYFLENRDRLLSEGKIDTSQNESLPGEVKLNQAEVDRLRAEVGIVERLASQAAVTAPFDGIVTSLNATAGVSAPTGTVLLTLTKDDPIVISFNLPATESGGIAAGTTVPVKVEGFGDQIFSATVRLVGGELSPASHTFEVKAELPNPNRIFKTGMEAQVTFESKRMRRVRKIPAQAVVTDNEKDFVYVVVNNKVWPVRVYPTPDPENPMLVEVEGNIKDDSIVVIEGQKDLKAGDEVNLWR